VKLGVGSYTYPWAVGIAGYVPDAPLNPEALLTRAERLGVRVLQICDNMPLDELNEAELGELRDQADDRGIELEVGTRGLAPEWLRQYLWLAGELGSTILRTVLDRGDDRPTPEEAVERIAPLLPEFAEAQVRLAIENHDRFMSDTWEWIVESLDSPWAGICLDTANSFGALEGPGTVIPRLAPHAVALHVKDFRVVRVPSHLGFRIEGAPAGGGMLDVAWLLATWREAGGTGNAILELWPPYQGSLHETLELEERWAEESVRYLRRFIPD